MKEKKHRREYLVWDEYIGRWTVASWNEHRKKFEIPYTDFTINSDAFFTELPHCKQSKPRSKTMKQYILIKSDEDGNPITFLDNVNDVLESPGDYGIETFLTSLPKNKDPNYWKEGEAILAEIKILSPKVKATAFKL